MTDSFLMLYPEVLAVLCVQVILSYIIETFSNGCISFSVNEFGDSFVRRMMDALVSKIFCKESLPRFYLRDNIQKAL